MNTVPISRQNLQVATPEEEIMAEMTMKGTMNGRDVMKPDTAIVVTSLPRQERIAAGVIAGIFLLTAVGAACYGLIVLASAAKEILVAVIAGSASLLSAVFAYAFQRAKDMELAAIQRKKELEAAERKVKQENYARIVTELAAYVRSPSNQGDKFTTAALLTWVVGTKEVVEETLGFIKENPKTPQTLDRILLAMRRDLDLSADTDWRPSTENLLTPPPAAGGLTSQTASQKG